MSPATGSALKMRFDTLLFDLDGTLVDSLADLTTAVNLLRSELDLPPLDTPTVRSFVGDGATMLVRRALPEGEFSAQRLRHFLDLYRDHLLDRTVPYEGIRELLSSRPPEAQAVVTNKPLVLTQALLEGLGLRQCFGAVVGGDSCPEKKPHPAPVQSALAALSAGAATAVMIGDHHTDLRAGRAAGLKTCFCAWGFGQDGGVPYDFHAATPADLTSLFAV